MEKLSVSGYFDPMSQDPIELFLSQEMSATKLLEVMCPADAVSGLAQVVDRLRKVESAARKVHSILESQCGTNDDWPLDLVARDEEAANQISDALNQLKNSLKR